MSEDTGLDARARYAILKKLNATMPPTQRRGQRLRRDCSLKAEETDTGQISSYSAAVPKNGSLS